MMQIKAESIHPSMSALVAELKKMGARRVLLFGSRARGDQKTYSDIDLAIDWPDMDVLFMLIGRERLPERLKKSA